jgi:hypothetical protein
VLRIALRATALRAALDPGDRCGPWDQEERAGPGLPLHPPGTQARRGGAPGRQEQLNWHPIVIKNEKLQT